MTDRSAKYAAYEIEAHSIDHIATAERHGKVRDQGPFWFTGNLQFLSISVGFIGPSNGLSFGWTSVAGILGILFGTLFMAFHATQGPVLGLPQMVQSRAQFGYRGVVVPLVGALTNFGGMNVVCAVLITGGLHNLLGWNLYLTLLGTVGLPLLLAIYGYDWVHRVFKLFFWVSLPLIVILTVEMAGGAVTSHAAPPNLGFNLVAFGMQFAAGASYNIAFAPYVSDYSRYLKHDTKPSHIIAAVFVGAAGSASWLIVVGAWLATRLNATDPLVALSNAGDALFPGFGTILALDSALVLLAVIAIDNYSGMLTLVTGVDSIHAIKPSRRIRILFTCLFTAAWVTVMLMGGQDAIAELTLVLTLILYMLVPWTAVNLVDYFYIRRGHYAVMELFKPHGIYGQWGWRGLTAYALGWAAITPFAVVPGLWTGPLAARLGGVDIGWLAGLLAAGGSYYIISKNSVVDHKLDVIRAGIPALVTSPAAGE